jgi:hypothetical protein
MIGSNEGGFSRRCPHCNVGLNLHQPDECSPDQLLATCDACFRWYCLMELGDEHENVLMIELPGKAMIEMALAKDSASQR